MITVSPRVDAFVTTVYGAAAFIPWLAVSPSVFIFGSSFSASLQEPI